MECTIHLILELFLLYVLPRRLSLFFQEKKEQGKLLSKNINFAERILHHSDLWVHMIHDGKTVHMAHMLMLIHRIDYVPWLLCLELVKILLNLKCFNVRNI